MIQDLIFGLAGGLLIGTAAALLLLGNGRIAGISGILGGVLARIPEMRGQAEGLAFLAGLIGLPALYALTAGAPAITVTASVPLLVTGGRAHGDNPSEGAPGSAAAAPPGTGSAACRGCRRARWWRPGFSWAWRRRWCSCCAT